MAEEKKIVEAVGTAGGGGDTKRGSLGKLIEEAMSQAVLDCMAEGISDPDKVREAKLAAREKAKKVYNQPAPVEKK